MKAMKLSSDPAQQKLALPLIAVLIVAVTVTVVRFRAASDSHRPLQPTARDNASRPVASPQTVVQPYSVVAGRPAGRNPFDIPPSGLLQKSVSSGQPQASASESAALPGSLTLPASDPRHTVRPPLRPVTFPFSSGLSIQRPGAQGSVSVAGHSSDGSPERNSPPDYHLGAIISGPRGKVAVIKEGGDGQSLTVSEGQALDSEYRVVHISQGQVVLNGPGGLLTLTLPRVTVASE
ncbi:MAG: hypothetical protein IT209_08530 [Armatimonadetes bacterium]|nr:hypothetical protein [Armatimonadota bacterium]